MSLLFLLAIFLIAITSCSSGQDKNIRVYSTVSNGAGDDDSPAPRHHCSSSAHTLESIRREIIKDVMLSSHCGGGRGGYPWIQVASLDMSDGAQQCPSPWEERDSPARACAASVSAVCQGVTFPVPPGVTYSQVCGRAIGYGHGSLDGFAEYLRLANGNIDLPYLDGVSITHGSPRQHIWSLAGGHEEPFFRCPCENPDRGQAPLPPSYVGANWFCDGEYNGALWDGKDCSTDCCNSPWFSASLPNSTSDDIEVRICSDEHPPGERVELSLIELFVSQ